MASIWALWRSCHLWAKHDEERRAAINTIAPHWDGNQVWFITAGGALFAAWPMVYATAFSGMYWALLLVLFALFLRPVGFDYRSKLQNTKWRNVMGLGFSSWWCCACTGLRCGFWEHVLRRAI